MSSLEQAKNMLGAMRAIVGSAPISTSSQSTTTSDHGQFDREAAAAVAATPLAESSPPPKRSIIAAKPGELTYLYLDAFGSLHGPFSESQMILWTQAGFFQASLLVSPNDNAQQFIPLQSVSTLSSVLPLGHLKAWNQLKGKQGAHGIGGHAGDGHDPNEEEKDGEKAEEDVDLADTRWFYTDLENRVQGPYEYQQMCEWIKSAIFPPTLIVCRQRGDRKATPGEGTQLTLEPAFANVRPPPLVPGATVQYEDYTGMASFSSKGKFTGTSGLSRFEQRGLTNDFNSRQMHSRFDIDGYQDAMRRAEKGKNVRVLDHQASGSNDWKNKKRKKV